MTEPLTALFEGLAPLWEMSFAAAWAAGVVFLLRLLLKKRTPRRVICLLWLVVFARLLIPVTAESPVSLMPPAPTQGGTAFQVAGTVPTYPPVQSAGPSGESPLPAVTAPVPSETVGTAVPAPVGPVVSAPVGPVRAAFPWKAMLAGVWLTGTAAMLGYGTVTWFRLRRRVRFAVRVSDRVWEDENVTSPFILGLFRPRVYLPSGLEGQARQFILCHEFAHLRRFDHIVKPLCWMALALHWFNPAVWVAFLLLSRDMEAACDEAVLRSLGEDVKADYSYTLLALASGRRVPAPCPLAFDEGDAKGRIKSVLSYRRPALWITVVSVLVVAVAAVCLLTDPVAEKGPEESPAPSEPVPTAEPSQANGGDMAPSLDPWMLEVLNGERTFSIGGTVRDIDHLAEAFFGDEPPENLGLTFRAAILDLDGDGGNEMVLRPVGAYDDTIIYQTGYLILRQVGDAVQGCVPGWRSFYNLMADGTFYWSNSAFEGGTGHARFEDGEFTVEKAAWVDHESYFVEGRAASLEEYEEEMQRYAEKVEPIWHTFENGTLHRIPPAIPLFHSRWSHIELPDFLNTDQQDLYTRAYSFYTRLFGPATSAIDEWAWPGPEALPPAEPVEVDGTIYRPSTGLFAWWSDLENAALSVFTRAFWKDRNTVVYEDGTSHQIFINVDGRTYYIDASRGNHGTNPYFPDTFHLPKRTDSEISFVLIGHYSEEHPLEGESFEERDARVKANWEEYIGYPMRLVLTENGWRFDEFHSAGTDHALMPFLAQAAPNPALTDDPQPKAGACAHGLDHVYVDHLTDGRLVFRCQEDYFPYYPPYPGAYSSYAIWEGDCDGDGHMEEIVTNSAGTLMLCDVVGGEMKTFTFTPNIDGYPKADLSTAWIEPGDELIYCVPLRDEPNGAPTGTVKLRLHYDGTALTHGGPEEVAGPGFQ